MLDHDALIDALSSRAAPVARAAPVWMRTTLLVPIMLGLGFAATMAVYRIAGQWAIPANGMGIASAALSLLLGVVGLYQALSISLADGAVRGKGWMMATVALWLAFAAVSISASSASSIVQGQHPFCFLFLLVAGLPMVGVVILAVRRTRSLRPVQSLVFAGCSVAFLSFGLLAFCHPVEMSIPDFVMHLMAASILGLLTVALGRGTVAA